MKIHVGKASKCLACQPKCAGCGSVFTTSTAIEAPEIFCSQLCQDGKYRGLVKRLTG